MEKLRKEKRSPLKEPPLHLPGQSVNRKILDLVMDKVLVWLVVTVVFAFGAFVGWVQLLFHARYIPVFLTVGAICAGVFTWHRVRKTLPEIGAYARGRDGEIAVGQYLDQHKPNRYRIFHDIPHDKGNIDHVLVGPGGIFVIETKTISKPTRRDARVVYRDNTLTVDGQVPDRDPIAQVKAEAGQLENLLRKFAPDDTFPIRKVVLYPGWFTESKGTDVWVLNEDALVKWIHREYKKLSDEKVQFLAGCIDLYVRNYRSQEN